MELSSFEDSENDGRASEILFTLRCKIITDLCPWVRPRPLLYLDFAIDTRVFSKIDPPSTGGRAKRAISILPGIIRLIITRDITRNASRQSTCERYIIVTRWIRSVYTVSGEMNGVRSERDARDKTGIINAGRRRQRRPPVITQSA